MNYPENMPDNATEEIHLKDFLHLLLKRRWTILTVFIVCVTTVTIKTFSMSPVYKATTTIRIEKEVPKVLSFEDILPDSEQYYNTQYEIIESRTLAMRVINKLDLQKHAQFKDKSKIAVVADAEADENYKKEEKQKKIINSFLNGLEVTPVKNSSLVKLTFNSNYPKLSAEISNTLAKEYIDFTLESKFKASKKAKDWLAGQLGDFQAKVETSEERLQAFARKKGIFSLEKDENIIMQKLEKLGDVSSSAEAERISSEALFVEISNNAHDDMFLGVEDDFLKTLKGQYFSLEAEYFKLSGLYKPEYPKMVRLKTQIESIERRIKEENKQIIKKVEVSYKTAVKKEELLRKSFNDQKKLALKMKENAVQYNILKREVDTNKELYDGLLQRLKETGISAGLDSSNIQIIDMAESPLFPSKPRKKLNVVLSMIVGLGGGIMVAFFFEYMDNTIKGSEEIERYFQLNALGIIPSLESVTHRKKDPEVFPEFISFFDSQSSLSEAFRSLRTSIFFSSPGAPPKTILITSTLPGEGKTTVSVNLGIVLAQAGKKVLIIDGDLRKASCHKVFSMPSYPGLTSCLTGNSDLQAIVKPTKVQGLYLAPAGPTPPNPTELLGSFQLRKIIRLFKEHFDFIIIDSPPVLGFADTPTLSTLVDGVIPVVFCGKTPKDEIKRMLGQLKGVNAHILGVVLNKFDIKKHAYNYYSPYYYYGKKYGEEDRSKDKTAYNIKKKRGVNSLSA